MNRYKIYLFLAIIVLVTMPVMGKTGKIEKIGNIDKIEIASNITNLSIHNNSILDVPINEAVDNYDITFSTGGIVPWFGQTSVSTYGGDAAQSGTISNGQNSWLQTTVLGYHKYIRFTWKVSSEKDYDFLNVYMDGELLDRISGEVDWETKTYYIPTNWHTFEWKYEKDGSVSAGSDTGWVDKVEYITSYLGASLPEALDNYNLNWQTSAANGWYGETPISISGGDAAQSGYIWDGEKTYLDSGVTGPGNLYFYWKVSSQPTWDALIFYVDGSVSDVISGNVDWKRVGPIFIGPGYHTLRWSYDKDVGITGGADAGWVDDVEFIPSTISIGQAVDNTGLTWNTGSQGESWYGQTSTSYYGGDAAQSGQIGHSSISYVMTSITGPGTLSYYWKVSSEPGYDHLKFYMDGFLKDSISGEVGWQKKTYTIGSGSHSIEWSYEKDGSISAGNDAGWLDKVQFTKSYITVVSPNGGENWIRGSGKEIKWNHATGSGSYVKIELYKGGVLNRVISSSTPNDGSYFWIIPSTQTLGSDYKIKITSTSNSAYFDSSNSNFIISSGNSITVTSPNGGENWYRGSTKAITWLKTGSTGSYVRITLYKGGVYLRTISTSTPNDGYYAWTIPTSLVAGSDYKVRITSTSNSAYYDWTNYNFKIS